ncbi:alternative ribosome rescue aminoacyl-tRNA hydrolase ArfB [Desulfobacterota bacterium M19]
MTGTENIILIGHDMLFYCHIDRFSLILRPMLKITPNLNIPLSELSFTFSRSSGPGGQHVNKVNSRVTLWFNIQQSPSLSETQKNTLSQKLTGRINRHGRLWLVSDRHRAQMANRQDVLLKFCDLLREGLKTKPRRKKTRVTRAAREHRLKLKKNRSRLKIKRRQPGPGD